MTLFQAIFIPACGAMALLTLVRSWRAGVAWRIGLFWGLSWSAAAVLIAFPSTAAGVARWLGIGRGADLLLYIAMLAGLGTCLFFYARYRHLERLLTELIRRESITQARQGNRRQDGAVSH